MESNLRKVLSKFYPHLDFKLVSRNDFKIGSFFQSAESIPNELRFNIIYKYICDACQATYIGSSTKQAKIRFYQHLGISHRTGFHLKNPPESSIREHCLDKDHLIKISNFSILSYSNSIELRTLESIYISKLCHSLNKDASTSPLIIL